MTCVECQELLSQLQKRELGKQEAQEVATHVKVCQTCQERLDVLEQLDAFLRALPTPPPQLETLLSIRDEVHRAVLGDEILDADQVATYLKLSRDEVLSRLDELPCFEVAGRVRFRRDTLLRWIESREVEHRRSALLSRMGPQTAFARPA